MYNHWNTWRNRSRAFKHRRGFDIRPDYAKIRNKARGLCRDFKWDLCINIFNLNYTIRDCRETRVCLRNLGALLCFDRVSCWSHCRQSDCKQVQKSFDYGYCFNYPHGTLHYSYSDLWHCGFSD